MAHNVEHGAYCMPGNDHSVLYFDGSDVIFCSYFSAADAPVVYEDMMRWGPTLRPVNDATEGSTQEAPMGASCVLPRKVGKIV